MQTLTYEILETQTVTDPLASARRFSLMLVDKGVGSRILRVDAGVVDCVADDERAIRFATDVPRITSAAVRLKRAEDGRYTCGARFLVRPWWNEMAGGGKRRRDGWLLCDGALMPVHCSDLTIVRETIAARLA
jgi:hypothetical protein